MSQTIGVLSQGKPATPVIARGTADEKMYKSYKYYKSYIERNGRLANAAGIAYKGNENSHNTTITAKGHDTMLDENTKDELKRALPLYVDQITQKSRKGNYICPICKSGTGKNKTGAFSIFDNGKAWQCFSCRNAGDIFKLIELVESKTEFADQAARAAEIAGMRIETAQPMKTTKPALKAEPVAPDPAGRYAEYIAKCHAAINETDYFNKRGFDAEAIERFNLGYDEKKEAVVIPYDPYGNYYITRDIKTDPNSSEHQFRKPKTDEAGQEPIYNSGALKDNKPCFVCESPIDAISITIAGQGNCNAISLGGTGTTKLIEAVKEKAPECVLVLSFDNDDINDKGLRPGQEAAAKLAAQLADLGISYVFAEYSLDSYPQDAHKDANDFLRGNRNQFESDIKQSILNAEIKGKEPITRYSASTYLSDFIEENAVDQPAIDTGFEVFNYCMDGGLYPGLYILGAISSLGKTSYLLQLADQVAAKGNDVLYFTLEMGANELIAKSLSRYSYMLSDKRETESLYTRSITNKELRDSLTITQQENYRNAIKKYAEEVAPHLWYFESLGEIGIEEIKRQIAQHVKLTGNKPLIFIDYLQIMKPYDMSWTEKRSVDKTVIELRKIARDYKTTVFAISSLNRSSYNGDIDMDAFKESGAIEYGSDVLLGLQPRGMTKGRKVSDQNKNDELLEEARKASEKDVEIKVIKNRSGRTGQRIVLSFNAKFNYFQEGSTAKADFSKRWEQFKNLDGNVETLII